VISLHFVLLNAITVSVFRLTDHTDEALEDSSGSFEESSGSSLAGVLGKGTSKTFLIRFADLPQTRHVSAVRNLQMSARRGADAQDSPATKHPKADVLSRPSPARTILAGFNIASALRVQRALRKQLDYNLPWVRGRRDHDRRYCGSGSFEGKPKARVKVREHGPESLHTPVRSPGAAIRRPISAGTRARTVCINSSVVHKLLVLSVSS
jgi:hypothetical protein